MLNKTWQLPFLCLMFFSLIFFTLHCDNEDPLANATTIEAGYAETVVSAPIGAALGGFGLPGGFRVITDIHDDMMAQVAFFKNDVGGSFMLITIDAAGYMLEFGDWGPGIHTVRESIVNAVSSEVRMKPEYITITSSHSHAAADIIGFWQSPGNGPPVDYLNELVTKITNAAVEAVTNRKSVNLYIGETMLEGYTGRDDDCSDVLDDRVTIVQAKDLDDVPIFTVVNWPLHPTTLGDGNTSLSADFVWGFREEMKNQVGGGALFVQGFIAAVHRGPNPVEGSGWDRVYNMGKVLSDKVIEYLPNLTLAEDFNINHRWKTFSCPVEGEYVIMADALGILKRNITESGGQMIVDTIETSWHRVGPLEIGVMPGEPTPELSLDLRERMVSPFQMIIGLGNDEMGYIIDQESIEKDNGRLASYELLMGLGEPIGIEVWKAQESMGWFNGAAENKRW